MVDDVWSYARETDNGFTHVLRWMRVLSTLGAIEAMTSAEARGYAVQYPGGPLGPGGRRAGRPGGRRRCTCPDGYAGTPEPTPVPNQAPVVNTQSKRTTPPSRQGQQCAQGHLVWKRFQGIFSDPDGDDLTYSVAVTQGRTELVELLLIHPDGQSDSNGPKHRHHAGLVPGRR